MKKCFEIPAGQIALEQSGVDNFTVTYGQQVDARLNYADAAAKLGQAIMHWLACESKLDNRTNKEAREDRRAFGKSALILAFILAFAPLVTAQQRITEDDPRWDCRTMGNKICGETPKKAFYCGAPTKKGAPCKRRVRAAGLRCYQHRPKGGAK